jgi:hypothetical protein
MKHIDLLSEGLAAVAPGQDPRERFHKGAPANHTLANKPLVWPGAIIAGDCGKINSGGGRVFFTI